MVLVITRKNNEQTFFGSTNISESFSNFVTRKQMEFLQKATEWLIQNEALVEQGIFRVPGNNDDMQAFKSRMNKIKWSTLTAEEADKIGAFDNFDDVHTVASLIKLFFRELKEPLLTFEYYDMFSYAASIPMERTNVKLEFLKKVFVLLPETNYLMMKTLISFLFNVTKHKEVNKMDSANLAICFAPSLIRPKNSSNKTVLEELKISQHLITLIIDHYDYFFEDKDLVEETAEPESEPSPAPQTATTTTAATTTNETPTAETETPSVQQTATTETSAAQQPLPTTPEPAPQSKEKEQSEPALVEEMPVIKTRTRHRTAAIYRTVGPAVMRRPRHESLMAFEVPESASFRSDEPIVPPPPRPIIDSEKHPSALQANPLVIEKTTEEEPVVEKPIVSQVKPPPSEEQTATQTLQEPIEPAVQSSTSTPTPSPAAAAASTATVTPKSQSPSAQAASIRRSKVMQMKSRLEELERQRMHEMLEIAQSRKLKQQQDKEQQEAAQEASPPQAASSSSVEGTSTTTTPTSSKSAKSKRATFAADDDHESCDCNPLQQTENNDDQSSRRGVKFQEPPPLSNEPGEASDDSIPFLPKRPMPRRRATVMIGMEEKRRLVSLWEGRILENEELDTDPKNGSK